MYYHHYFLKKGFSVCSEIFKINHQEVTDDSQANGMHTLLVPAVVYSPIITENYGIFTEFDTLKDRQ